MINSSHKFTLRWVQNILETFRLSWRLFLGIHISVNVLSLVVLTPLVTLVISWLILTSGDAALTDEDILFFALSPTGLLVMLLVGGLYTTVLIFEQATMLTSAHSLALGRTVSLAGLGRFLLIKSWVLFRLSLHMIGRSILIAAPFLAAGALVYGLLLAEFDINYYLSEKPPVLWWAGGLILACLLIMAIVLLRVFSGWILTLPLVLFTDASPAHILKTSREHSVSMRIRIVMILLVLSLLNVALFALVSALTDLAVDGVVALPGNSLHVMAYMLGSLVVIWLLANFAITFFSNSLLSLVILDIYNRLVGTTDVSNQDKRLKAVHSGRPWDISLAKIVGIALLLCVATGFALDTIIERMGLEDNTVIIAHRGASADAPENTLSALQLAITEGADWVEIDVQETREGEIVVIHDSDLKRVGGSELRVFESSLEELQKVDIGSWKDPALSDQRIPTLQQVLELCKGRVKLVIELKYYGQEKHFEERVATLVEAAGMQDQVVIMSLSYAGIQKMKSIRPQWPAGLLSSVALGDVTRLKVDFFAVNAKFANRAFIRRVHNRNRKVIVWTVNDPIDMSAMMSKGVDGIITDKPGLALSVRQERKELGTHERIMIQLASWIGRQPARPQQ